MKDYKKIVVWQKAHLCALEVYKQTNSFPKEEMYGLISQLRRCAVSIPSNIAEGCGRNTEPELRRFLVIAHGSAAELSYQVLLSKDLGYLTLEAFKVLDELATEIMKMLNELATEIMKMLNAFIQKL